MFRTIKEAMNAKKYGTASIPSVPVAPVGCPKGTLALIREYGTGEYAFTVAYPWDGRISSQRGLVVKTFTA